MQEKQILISGGSDGIGKGTALGLARLGASITILGRREEHCRSTVAWLKKESRNERIRYFCADLSDMDQVKGLSEKILDRFNRLDVLVNNAGGIFLKKQLSAQGWEMTFALNHMNYFYLSHLLLPLLKKTADKSGEARVVVVSSGAHKSVNEPLNFDDIHMEKENYSGWRRYCESKLMNLYFTFSLHELLQGSQVTVNALHPGFVNSSFGNNNMGLFGLFIKVGKAFMARGIDKGAETIVHLSSSELLRGTSGKYYHDKQERSVSQLARDKDSEKKIWDLSLNLLGLKSYI